METNTYQELLRKPEWQKKCQEIIHSSGPICAICKKVGGHNSYFPIDSIETLDCILQNRLFNGKKLSAFIESDFMNTPSYNYKEKTIRESRVIIMNNNRYRVSCYKDFPWSTIEFYSPKSIGETVLLTDSSHIDNITISCNNEEIKQARFFSFAFRNIEISNWARISYSRDENSEKFVLAFLLNNRLFEISALRWYNNNNPMFNYPQLHIHHQYYIKNRKPWDYDNQALITVCAECHKRIHDTTKIPLYENEQKLIKLSQTLSKCAKCGGSGYLPQYYYYVDGVCFDCYGEGVVGIDW